MDLFAGSAAESVHALVGRCVAGEADAWRGLHRRYHGVAVAVLRRFGVAPSQLEDTCQEVFLDVFQYLPRFRHEADFRTWLYRICVSHAKVARRRARLSGLLSSLLATFKAEPVSDTFDGEKAGRQLARALEALTEAERVVFVLFELEGLSGKEIAEILKRPEATVFRRLHDARKRFRAAVEAAE